MGTGLVLFASQLAGGPAHAQSKEELDKARALFLEGVSLAAANNCAAALGKYQAVAKVKMTAQVAYNMAECQERLGKLVSSLGSYRLAASLVVDGQPEVVAKTVGDRVASIEARIPRLIIERTEQTSRIELDGVEIGSSQIGVENLVDPGAHIVSGKVGETEVWRESVTVAEKESKTVTVKIDLAKFKPPEPTATVTAIYGSHRGSHRRASLRVPAYVVGGIGVLSLGVGFALMGTSLSTASELEQLCGTDHICPASEKGKYDSGRTTAGVSMALLGVGAAALATGVVLFIVRSPSSSQPPAATEPAAARRFVGPEVGVAVRGGPGSTGLSVVGRF
ncbi:MAG: hypothetical protein R3B70_30975 [Polyangiaceae bacterium]